MGSGWAIRQQGVDTQTEDDKINRELIESRVVLKSKDDEQLKGQSNRLCQLAQSDRAPQYGCGGRGFKSHTGNKYDRLV